MMASEGNGFSVLETDLDGLPLIAVINVELRDHRHKSGTPWFISISTPYTAGSGGLPSSKDVSALDHWEQRIVTELAADAVFVGRVTWNGHRELLYYLTIPEPSVGRLEALSASGTSRAFG